jgi:ABC-type Fe3+/spermidine/putrescine transport system ATPase subunit
VAGFLGAMNWVGAVGVRPEAVRLLAPGDTRAGRSVAGEVRGRVFLGDCVQVQVRLESGEEILAQVDRQAARFQPGEPVVAAWNPEDEIELP